MAGKTTYDSPVEAVQQVGELAGNIPGAIIKAAPEFAVAIAVAEGINIAGTVASAAVGKLNEELGKYQGALSGVPGAEEIAGTLEATKSGSLGKVAEAAGRIPGGVLRDMGETPGDQQKLPDGLGEIIARGDPGIRVDGGDKTELSALAGRIKEISGSLAGAGMKIAEEAGASTGIVPSAQELMQQAKLDQVVHVDSFGAPSTAGAKPKGLDGVILS